MKEKYNNDKDPNYYAKPIRLGDLDRLAREIDAIARGSLRDGVLGGILKGHEGDIRQDAILLILRWVLRGEQEGNDNGLTKSEKAERPWNLSHAVAKALRICKMRTARALAKLAKGQETLTEINGGVCSHHSDLSPWDWPNPVKGEMALRGLRVAVKSGQLSHANACVAVLILEGCMSVDQVAKNLKVSSGAIYQQLQRIKRILPSMIDRMEPPHL
jgi:DNA-binding CsgD family transcriptional regulator